MKGKKILSAIIAGAMVLCTMSFSVFAEGEYTFDVDTASSLKTALNTANSANGQAVTINITANIDAADTEYAFNWNGATAESSQNLTINGNGYAISNMTTPLISSIWHGDILTINDLTINSANITISDPDDNGQSSSAAAFVAHIEASDYVTFNRCKLTNSTVSGGRWNGGFVGYAAGYSNINDGAVFTEITFNNCEVSGNTLSSEGSVGGLMGHAMGSTWTKVNIINTSIFSNSITCIGTSTQKAGAICGTIGCAGIEENGKTGGMIIDTTELANNTVKSNGVEISTFYGRQGNSTGVASIINKTLIVDSEVYTDDADFVQNLTYAAKIGNNYYATLADAVAAAQNGDTIDLLDNTIELDGQTTIDKDVTIINGTFDITDAVCTTEGIIYIDNKTVEFNNVDLIGSNFTSAFGVIYANHNADVTLDNCDFTLKNDLAPKGGTLKGNDNASFTVKNCTFDLENPSRVLTSITLDMSDTTINAYVTDPTRVAGDLNNHAFRNVYGEIKDSTIDVKGTETGLKNTDSGSLSITGTSNVSFTNTVDNNIYLADANETFTVAPTATLNGEVVYGTVSEATITDEITVDFVPTADKNVYDIVLDGNYKEIYEFVSAEIQFINAGNGYEIDGTDDINVIANTENSDRYGFYLKDGTLDNRITATKIKIGTVTFPAYGTINFKVEANNSTVVATEYNTHLEKYYTAADANAKLTADANGIDSTIAAKTRDVAINVDFAHTLDNTGWNGNHQITVTLKDAFGNIVGETAHPLTIENNAGTYTFADVPVGRITVTLKAPGFRTFTYTTTVEEGVNEDDALVLSFWNDTKRDAEKAVEIGGRTMKNNFVVGDIAMDYIVDKYDLAAVTSYYGTYNLTDENKIKYDLNRDGNIDITDVAYVLHNFGF